MTGTPSTTGTTPLYADLIPRILTVPSLNLLGGGSGVGKTALTVGLIRDIQAGKHVFGHATSAPPAIGYIAADRPIADAQLWFDAVGVTNVACYSLVDDLEFKTSRLERPKPGEHARIFEDMLVKLALPKGSLLIVDPIALFLGGDLNNYIRMALGCINLTRVIREYQLCVIGLVHSSKQSADAKQRYGRLQDRLSGSMAQLGYSATQMYLAGPDEIGESHHAFVWNPHHAKSEVFNLQQDDKTGLFSLHGTHEDTPGEPLVLSAELASLLAILPAPPTTFTVDSLMAEHSDMQVARTTVWRRLKTLEGRGLVTPLVRPYWVRTDPQPGDAPQPPQDTPPSDETESTD